MRDHSTQWGSSERLQIKYTAKPVSGGGGLVALVRYFDKVGLRALLQQALPDGRTSPNQIPAGEIILAFFAAVLTGAKRFAHVERLRADAVVRKMGSFEALAAEVFGYLDRPDKDGARL